jgi:hypothetical protein
MSATTSMTLPQLGSGLFLTDGGIETSLIFLDGLDLPYFAATREASAISRDDRRHNWLSTPGRN